MNDTRSTHIPLRVAAWGTPFRQSPGGPFVSEVRPGEMLCLGFQADGICELDHLGRGWINEGATLRQAQYRLNRKLGLPLADEPGATFLEVYRVLKKMNHGKAKGTVRLRMDALLHVVEKVYHYLNPTVQMPERGRGIPVYFDESPIAGLIPNDFITPEFAAYYCLACLGDVPATTPEGGAILRKARVALGYLSHAFRESAEGAYQAEGVHVVQGLDSVLVVRENVIIQSPPRKQAHVIARIIAVHRFIRDLAKTEQIVPLLILLLALYAGLRRKEIKNFNLENLNRVDGWAISIQGKGGKYRHISIDQWLYELLEWYLLQQRDHCLLTGTDSAKDGACDVALEMLCAEVPSAVPNPLHELRAYFASYEARKNLENRKTKRQMGHAHYDMTNNIYVRGPLPARIAKIWKTPLFVFVYAQARAAISSLSSAA